jgi:mono/diheme cytochrome c family protein
MRRLLLRWRLVVIGGAGLAALASCWAAGGRGDQPAGQDEPGYVKVDPDKGKYLGATTCADCHTEPSKTRKDDYVRLTEYHTWKEEDKHSQAYQVLLTPRAVEMGKRLGYSKPPSQDSRCLNCHAMNIPPSVREERFDIKDGVSCDACHGPSEKWFLPHTLTKWRTTPMAEKEKLGFVDVRDPVKRTSKCVTCHVDDPGGGKLVTHAMYAAGHPPLPSFEVATFSDQMPRHWRYIKEKDPKIQELLQKNFDVDPQELEKTKLAVLGAAATFQGSMDCLAAVTKGGAADEHWPELSMYDCYACHHELRSPSWRQQRADGNVPGRPQMQTWPMALLRVVARYAGEEGPAEERLKAVAAGFNAQPFGKPDAICAAAGESAKGAGGLLAKLAARKYDQAAARRLLRDLCAASGKELLDYDSARQVAWVLRIIHSELDPKPPQDQQIQKVLDDMNKELNLKLPSGTKVSILDELSKHLQQVGNYDAEHFRQLAGELCGLLPPAEGE